MPIHTAKTLQEAARSLPNMGELTFKEWREEFERMIGNGERRESVESWLHHAFDNPRHLMPIDVALYLINFVDAPNWSNQLRGNLHYTHYALRKKALAILATNFFGVEEKYWMPVRSYAEFFATIWKFLACEENYPSEGTGRREGRLNDIIRTFVARTYYLTVGESEETFGEMRPDIVQALVLTKQLHLVFDYRDTASQMIEVLEEFALRHGRLESGVEPENIQEVLAFGYKHKPHPQAAALALTLRTIKEERERFIEEARQELQKRESKVGKSQ